MGTGFGGGDGRGLDLYRVYPEETAAAGEPGGNLRKPTGDASACAARRGSVSGLRCVFLRVCLSIAFCQLCVTVWGRFDSNEGGVAGCVDRMRAKYTAKWGVQLAGMIFKTRSNSKPIRHKL